MIRRFESCPFLYSTRQLCCLVHLKLTTNTSPLSLEAKWGSIDNPKLVEFDSLIRVLGYDNQYSSPLDCCIGCGVVGCGLWVKGCIAVHCLINTIRYFPFGEVPQGVKSFGLFCKTHSQAERGKSHPGCEVSIETLRLIAYLVKRVAHNDGVGGSIPLQVKVYLVK